MKLQLATTTTATTTTVASCRRCLRRIGDFHKWEPKHLFLDFHVTLFIVVGSARVALTSRTTQRGSRLCHSAPGPRSHLGRGRGMQHIHIIINSVTCNIMRQGRTARSKQHTVQPRGQLSGEKKVWKAGRKVEKSRQEQTDSKYCSSCCSAASPHVAVALRSHSLPLCLSLSLWLSGVSGCCRLSSLHFICSP